MSHIFEIELDSGLTKFIEADGYELDTDTGYINFHNGIETIASFAMRSTDSVIEQPEEEDIAWTPSKADSGLWMFSEENRPFGTDTIDEIVSRSLEDIIASVKDKLKR